MIRFLLAALVASAPLAWSAAPAAAATTSSGASTQQSAKPHHTTTHHRTTGTQHRHPVTQPPRAAQPG